MHDLLLGQAARVLEGGGRQALSTCSLPGERAHCCHSMPRTALLPKPLELDRTSRSTLPDDPCLQRQEHRGMLQGDGPGPLCIPLQAGPHSCRSPYAHNLHPASSLSPLLPQPICPQSASRFKLVPALAAAHMPTLCIPLQACPCSCRSPPTLSIPLQACPRSCRSPYAHP